MTPVRRAFTSMALVAALAPVFGGASRAAAQQLYKYQDANGVWAYTDRPPADGAPYEEAPLARRFEAPQVRFFRESTSEGVALMADNGYYGPVQVAFRLTSMQNLHRDAVRQGKHVLAARSQAQLALLKPADAGRQLHFEYQFQYLPGDPAAVHQPEQPYRLPFALASSFPVSQAPPAALTHTDPSSQHAIDFVMPVGTGVYAARGGIVLEVASDFYAAGVDPEADGPRANIVRVLHADGTMGLYAHLNWNSIRVVPGQSVSRGEYLADSGNTGFSTGPHLHFVVQRNDDGRIVSVPVQFAGPGGSAVTLATGDSPVAY